MVWVRLILRIGDLFSHFSAAFFPRFAFVGLSHHERKPSDSHHVAVKIPISSLFLILVGLISFPLYYFRTQDKGDCVGGFWRRVVTCFKINNLRCELSFFSLEEASRMSRNDKAICLVINLH